MPADFGEGLEGTRLPETAGKHNPYNSRQWDIQAYIFASFPRRSLTTPTFLFMQGKGGIIELIFSVKQEFFPISQKEWFPKG